MKCDDFNHLLTYCSEDGLRRLMTSLDQRQCFIWVVALPSDGIFIPYCTAFILKFNSRPTTTSTSSWQERSCAFNAASTNEGRGWGPHPWNTGPWESTNCAPWTEIQPLLHLQQSALDSWSPQRGKSAQHDTVGLLEFCDCMIKWDWVVETEQYWDRLIQTELNSFWPTASSLELFLFRTV